MTVGYTNKPSVIFCFDCIHKIIDEKIETMKCKMKQIFYFGGDNYYHPANKLFCPEYKEKK